MLNWIVLDDNRKVTYIDYFEYIIKRVKIGECKNGKNKYRFVMMCENSAMNIFDTSEQCEGFCEYVVKMDFLNK